VNGDEVIGSTFFGSTPRTREGHVFANDAWWEFDSRDGVLDAINEFSAVYFPNFECVGKGYERESSGFQNVAIRLVDNFYDLDSDMVAGDYYYVSSIAISMTHPESCSRIIANGDCVEIACDLSQPYYELVSLGSTAPVLDFDPPFHIAIVGGD
jgi:hypothetical protein